VARQNRATGGTIPWMASAGSYLTERMAPQVGLGRCPEILTAEVILLIFRNNARKTSVDAGFERVSHLSVNSGKAAQSEIGRTKVGHFFRCDFVRKLPKEPSKMDGSLHAGATLAGRSDDRFEAVR
jgi:hypothetical protein